MLDNGFFWMSDTPDVPFSKGFADGTQFPRLAAWALLRQLSDGRTLPLYEGMTALNTFPVLFNAYLGTDLPRLPDKHWFARMSEPYIYFPVEK